MRKLFAIVIITLFLFSNIVIAENHEQQTFENEPAVDDHPEGDADDHLEDRGGAELDPPQEQNPSETEEKPQQQENICERISCQPGCNCVNFEGCICPKEPPGQDCMINGWIIRDNKCIRKSGCDVNFGNLEQCEKAVKNLRDFDENNDDKHQRLRKEFEEKKRRSLEQAKRKQEEERKRQEIDSRVRQEQDEFRQEEQHDQRFGDSYWIEDMEYKIEDQVYNYENRLWEAKDLEEFDDVDASKAIKLLEAKIKDLKDIKSNLGKSERRELDRRMQRHWNSHREIDILFRELQEQSERKRVLEEAERFLEDKESRFLEEINWQLEELREFGGVTPELQSMVNEVKDSVDAVKELMKSKDLSWRSFERARRVADRNEQRIWRVLEESRHLFEVKRMLEEIDYHMSDAEFGIQEFKAFGIDVSEAEETMELVKDVIKKVKSLMKEGKAREAMKLFRGMEFVGRKMEKLFHQYEREFQSKGGELGKSRIKDVLEEAFERLPLAEEKIEDFKKEGIRTDEAERVLKKIKAIVFKAKELYKEDKNENAFFVIREAFPLGTKLERLFEEYENKVYGLGVDEDYQDDDYEIEDLGENKGQFGKLKSSIDKIKKEIKQILKNVDRSLPAAKEKLGIFKEAGVDTSKAEELVAEISAIIEDARIKFETNDFLGALNTIEKAYPLGDRLESEFSKFDKKRSKGNIKAEVESILNEVNNNLPRVVEAIDNFRTKGVDVSKAERLIKKIKDITKKAREEYNSGEYRDALVILQSAFPIESGLETLFEEYTGVLGHDDLKTQLDEIYSDTEKHLPEVRAVFAKLTEEGIDINEGEKKLDQALELLTSSKDLYNSEEYKKALHIVRKAEEIGVELGQLLEDYLTQMELGTEVKFIEESEQPSFVERTLGGGNDREEFDIYDKEFEEEYETIKDEIDEIVYEAGKDSKKNSNELFDNGDFKDDEEFNDYDELNTIEDLERFTERRFKDEDFDDRGRFDANRRNDNFENNRDNGNNFDERDREGFDNLEMERMKEEMLRSGKNPEDVRRLMEEKMREFDRGGNFKNNRNLQDEGFDNRREIEDMRNFDNRDEFRNERFDDRREVEDMRNFDNRDEFRNERFDDRREVEDMRNFDQGHEGGDPQ